MGSKLPAKGGQREAKSGEINRQGEDKTTSPKDTSWRAPTGESSFVVGRLA